MDSLDQILALGNHLSGRSSEMAGIQTADLLNLHSEEKSSGSSFDPFANSTVSTSGAAASGLGSKTSIPIQVSTCSVVPSIPPPPGSQSQNMPSSQLKTTFSETFGDSFVSTNSSLHVNPLVPPPAKSPKVKATSSGISHYSTIRPRKKSNNESEPSPPLPTSSHPVESSVTSSSINTLPPPSAINYSTLKVRKIGGESKSPNSLKSTAAIPRPTSANSNASSSPRSKATVDSFDCQPFCATFTTETSSSSSAAAAAFDKLDLFTDLDPLGTGRSRPYVDKKDFFQDLKKTNTAPKRLLKQMSTSQVEGNDHHQAKDWHQQLTVDEPFGILHMVSAPEPDPFDTNFASMTPPLFPTTFNSPSTICQPTSSISQPTFPSPTVSSSTANNYSKISKTSNFYARVWSDIPVSNSPPQPLLNDLSNSPKPNSSSRMPHGPLRVALPVTGQSDSDSEIANLTPRNLSSTERHEQSSAASGNGSLSWSPRVSPSLRPSPASVMRSRVEVTKSLQSGCADSPVPPLELSSSEEDSSSSEETSDRELSNQHKQNLVSLPIPPQPPPRPPVLRPPPLPPKGQPPLIAGQPPLLPQRPILTPTDELVCSGNRTPPLPIPIRKPKQHQVSSGISGPRSRRTSSQEKNFDYQPGSPAKPLQPNNKLNQISLLQLSNMSLSELAATLQLPPARLASMTLTELALRLAELNSASENGEELRQEDEEKKIHTMESASHHHPYYPPAEEDEDFDEDEEDDEIKMESETEVCYKSGKQYEILSDEPDPSEQDSKKQHSTGT